MLGIFIAKFHELVPLQRIKIHFDCTTVWNKLPVNHTFRIPSDTHYFGAQPIFNDDFDRLSHRFEVSGSQLLTDLSCHVALVLFNLSSLDLVIS